MMMLELKNACPCCGFAGLQVPAYKNIGPPPFPLFTQNIVPPYVNYFGEPSYEVCLCCGYEFGFEDDPGGNVPGISFEHNFREWFANGCVWFDPKAKPSNWDLKQQLLEADLSFRLKPHLMKDQSEIINWVVQALQVAGTESKPLPCERARDVTAAARRRFVEGEPRSWWLGLKLPSVTYDSTRFRLGEVLPSAAERYWFIPETEEENLPVFDLTLEQIEYVISESPYFEYYVLNKELSWLVVESDHNIFHVSKV